jgi:hypothetical protein
MPPSICIRTSDEPLARLRGEWEITVEGERWYGPDTLFACLEAAPMIASCVAERVAVTN